MFEPPFLIEMFSEILFFKGDLAVHNGHFHLCGADLGRVDREDVAGEYDEVRQFAHAERAAFVFLKRSIGSACGKAAHGLFHGEALFRVPGLRAGHGRVDARNGTGEVRQQVERLHGAIRAAADIDAKVKERLPGVARFGKLRSDARFGDVLIRLHEDGLDVGLHAELRGAFEPILTGETERENHDIVKAADKLSAYIKCIEERKAGNNEFINAERQTLAALHAYNMPELEYFIENFIPAFEKTLDDLGGMD